MSTTTTPTFTQLLINRDLAKRAQSLGLNKPTPIQIAAIPIIREGKSTVAASPTGTGKTFAFLFPVIELLSEHPHIIDEDNIVLPRVLLLAPTRELANQLYAITQQYISVSDNTCLLLSGGESTIDQDKSLKKGADLIVATPGRLLEVLHKDKTLFDTIQCLILDEADRLLDLGFEEDLKRILSHLPKEYQTLLFSATYNKDVKELAQQLLPGATYIGQANANIVAKDIKQILHPVDHQDKGDATITLLHQYNWKQTLIFTKTKKGADKLTEQLKREGFDVDTLHGDKKPHQRKTILNRFRSGRLKILVATDVASRGLDIENLPGVINHDLPPVAQDYIHRIGRTARAGEKGIAVSLVAAHEIDTLCSIEMLLGYTLIREDLIGHVPNHRVPETHAKRTQKRISGDKDKRSDKQGDTLAAEKKSKSLKTNKTTPKQSKAKSNSTLFSSRKNITKRSID